MLSNLLIVSAAAFAVPLLLGLVGRLRLPAIALEIVAGIVLGPAGLGVVEADAAVRVLSLIGLAFLLFLAGLELEFRDLRGRILAVAGLAAGASTVLALAVGLLLAAAGVVDNGLFFAIVLTATALGIVIPLLKDAGVIATPFGQLVVAGASIAEFGSIVLLTLVFSADDASSPLSRVLLLVIFVVAAAAVVVAITGAERVPAVRADLERLQDTTAQIRVRLAFVLLLGLAVLANRLGLELILGAFAAGAAVTLIDRDEAMIHPQFRTKLEAVGFGVFIPVFFVSSGIAFDLDALSASPATVARVPLFLAALLLVRGLPALLYARLIGAARVPAAALLQATSLSFLVAATQIGRDLGVVGRADAAALVAAGLLSVLLFPAAAFALLARAPAEVG